MYKPHNFHKWKSRSCICTSDSDCTKITKKFFDAGDVRGTYIRVTNPKEQSRKSSDYVQLQFWRKRMCEHAQLNYEFFCQDVSFNLPKPEQQTRARTKEQTKKDAYIAAWHFAPACIDLFYDSSTKTFCLGDNKKKFRSKEELNNLDLYSERGGSAYSKIDCYKEDENAAITDQVAIVPTLFSVESAISDYNNMLKCKQSHDVIKAVRESPLPSRSKRRRQSTSNDTTSKKKAKTSSKVHSKEELESTSQEDLVSLVLKLQKECKQAEKHIQRIEDNESKLADLKQAVIAEDISKCNTIAVDYDEVIAKLKETEERMALQTEQLKIAGLNRCSMSHPDIFENNDRLCNDLYGFPDFCSLKSFIIHLLDVEYTVSNTIITKTGGTNKYGSQGGSSGLTEFEQVLLTLFYCNTHFNYYTIGSMFGIASKTTVRTYIDKWLPLLGELGTMLSCLTEYIDSKALNALEPESYKRLGLQLIAAVVDGKDFMSETCRRDRVLNSAQISNKVNHSAFRVLTWSLPCGAIIEHTPAIFGRASEKAILRAWGELGRLKFPVGYLILGDKGFDKTAGSYTNFNTTLHPAFLTNKQFSRTEINHNIEICQKRYTCEVVYSRVANMQKLSGVIKRETFHHFEDLLSWGHGRANICYNYLQTIDDYNHFN